MKKVKTASKKTSTNNVVVTFRKLFNGEYITFCGRYKTIENAKKDINSNRWNSPKNLGWEVVEIKEL